MGKHISYGIFDIPRVCTWDKEKLKKDQMFCDISSILLSIVLHLCLRCPIALSQTTKVKKYLY